jgi:hypothetical protein
LNRDKGQDKKVVERVDAFDFVLRVRVVVNHETEHPKTEQKSVERHMFVPTH